MSKTVEELQAEIDDMQTALTKANGEAADRRKTAKELKDKLAGFEGIDVEEIKTLKEKAAFLEQEKLKEAGKFEEALETALKDLKNQIATKDSLLSNKEQALHDLLASEGLRNEFKGKVNNEAQALKLMLENVKVEDNKLVILNGEDVRFNEAGNPMTKSEYFEAWIAENPHFQVPSGGGSGSQGNQGGDTNIKTISRATFDNMNPVEKAAHFKEGGTVTD
jgi:hypothetical protein